MKADFQGEARQLLETLQSICSLILYLLTVVATSLAYFGLDLPADQQLTVVSGQLYNTQASYPEKNEQLQRSRSRAGQ